MEHRTVEALTMAIEEHKASHPELCHVVKKLLECHLSRLDRFVQTAHLLLSSVDGVDPQTLRSALWLPVVFGQRDTID